MVASQMFGVNRRKTRALARTHLEPATKSITASMNKKIPPLYVKYDIDVVILETVFGCGW